MKNNKNLEHEYLHELLHGSFLVLDLLETAGESGKQENINLFEKYPELKNKYDEAIESVFKFYQTCSKYI